MSEAITKAAAYDLIDRFLRNNLYDDDYAECSKALEAISQPAPAPQPAVPVDEMIEALEDLMDWQVKNVALWHNRAYDRAYRAIKKHRAALQSPAPQTKGQS